MKAVVLVSGGMDSAAALGKACTTQGMDDVVALSIRYGSMHQDEEFRSAVDLAAFYAVNHVRMDLPADIFKGSGSALLGESIIPNEEYHDIEKETPSATVVPFRNAVFLAVATSFAEAHGFDQVWVANHASDAAGWAYPDCTPEFMGPMAAAIYVGTLRKVRLVTPFQFMSKAEIVALAADLEVPLQLTWSCYRGGEKPCGECPTCLERIKAFAVAGFRDPVEYLKPIAWDQELIDYPVPE